MHILLYHNIVPLICAILFYMSFTNPAKHIPPLNAIIYLLFWPKLEVNFNQKKRT